MKANATRIGATLAVVGAVFLLVGVGGLVLDRRPLAATPETPVRSASPVPETAAAFLDQLGAAIREGDSAWLLERLHPAVIERYGQERCRAGLSTFTDATAGFTTISVSPPGDYNWVTDGRSTVVPQVLTVTVDRVRRGETLRVDVHVGQTGNQLRWFTDCGDPL